MASARPTTPERDGAEMREAANILVSMANTPVDASGLQIKLDDVTTASKSSPVPLEEVTSKISTSLNGTIPSAEPSSAHVPPQEVTSEIPTVLKGTTSVVPTSAPVSPKGVTPEISTTLNSTTPALPSSAPIPPHAVTPEISTTLNGTSTTSTSISVTPFVAAPKASITSNGTLATSNPVPALSCAATTAPAVVISTVTQSASASNAVSRQSSIRDGTFRHQIVDDVSHPARPVPPISWSPTSQKYGRGSQSHASLPNRLSKDEGTNHSINRSAQPTKSMIHNTTEVSDFADFSVKPPAKADPSSHFEKIRSHSVKSTVAQQPSNGGIAFSVVNGRPRLDPVTQTMEKAGKSQTTPGLINGRINSGQMGRNAVPTIQTPFSSQRPVSQTSFNPFSSPSSGQPLPFWFPTASAPRMSTSQYGLHTTASPSTPSKSNAAQVSHGNGNNRTPLPSTPSKTASVMPNSGPRNPLPSAPLNHASISYKGNAPRTPLPARSSSKSAGFSDLQQSEAHQLMENRVGDMKFGGSAVTLDDLDRLEHMERALISDFFVLHGIFFRHPHYPGQPNEAAFVAGGFRNASKFYEFEDRMKTLMKKVETRLKNQAAEPTDSQKDWTKQLKEEHNTLDTLYNELLNCKKYLTELRKYLERENKVIPAGYRKSTAAAKKKATPAANAKTINGKATNGKKRQTFILIDSEDNTSEQGSTSSATQPPRKKAKTQPAQGTQVSSTTQMGPLRQDMNGSTMYQHPRGPSKVQSTNGSTIYHQPRGLVQAINGSGMQPHSGPPVHGVNGSGMHQPPQGPPPAPRTVQPRTPADVDRDIASKQTEVEKLQRQISELQSEIFELRWEKKVLVTGGEPGRH